MDVDVCIDVWDRRVVCDGVHGWSGEHVTGWFRDDGLLLIFWDAVLVCGEDVGSGRVSRVRQRSHWSFCRSSLVVDGVWGRGVGMVASCVRFACVS